MRAVLPERLHPLDPVRSIKAKLGLTAAAREMAAGRSPRPVSATSRDEVGELARAFTAMAADLASADGQRRDLLANVAHELRTPVAALRAQLENLVDGVRPADEVALAEALGQVENISGLLDDLLDLARAEAGVTPLQRSPVDVPGLVGAAVAEIAAIRPDRRLEVDVPVGLTAHIDPARLRQVLLNLLDNATRHTGEGGLVHVSGRHDGAGSLVLEVTDDGPGIAEQDRAAVFERFRHGALPNPAPGEKRPGERRGPNRTTSESPTGGTGLGLAIARWAVTLHGGRIEVVPAETGCRIRVELPAPYLPVPDLSVPDLD